MAIDWSGIDFEDRAMQEAADEYDERWSPAYSKSRAAFCWGYGAARQQETVRLRALLFRARTEMHHMLDCANKEEVPHDGDDFHETLQQIEKELGRTP